MKLSAPKQITFIIAIILAVLGILPLLGVAIPAIAGYASWLLVAAFVVLALGVILEGV